MKSETFPGRYESLAKIGEFVREAAQSAGLDDFAVYAVETAVDEACSNIIEHAYGGENKGVISCGVEITTDGLLVRLIDHGKPFKPEKIPSPHIKNPLKHRHAHGLGLYIMRKWMDEVDFQFNSESGNTLTMVKLREKKN